LIDKVEGAYVGLEAELALDLGEALDRKIEFVDIAWKELIPALEEKRIDIIIAGMSVKRERKERINFTDSFLDLGHAVLIREADVDKYPSEASVRAMAGTVGYEIGTTGEQLAAEQFIQAQKVGFTGAQDSVAALKTGEIDMMVYDIPEVWWLWQNNTEVVPVKKKLSHEFLAWGVHKEDAQLLADVNAVLEQWQFEGKMVEAVEYYLPYLQDFVSEDDTAYYKGPRKKVPGRRDFSGSGTHSRGYRQSRSNRSRGRGSSRHSGYGSTRLR